MANITTSKILNATDNSPIRLYVEWADSNFKVLVLRSPMAPLYGEMSTKDVNYYSEELSKTNNEYLHETRRALSGKDLDVQFFLRDEIFEWKRKKMWTLGRIKMHLVLDVKITSDILQQLLEYHQSIQERLLVVEDEVANLRESKDRLIAEIEEMVRIKCDMEKDLYMKFLLILNTKKKKIRELVHALKTNKDAKENSIFNAPTDESDVSSDEEFKEANNMCNEIVKSKKLKLNHENKVENNYENRCKSIRRKFQSNGEFERLDVSPKPSTSNDFGNETQMSLSTSSNETECEIELKYLETPTKMNTSSLNITEEELEDEVFSQT